MNFYLFLTPLPLLCITALASNNCNFSSCPACFASPTVKAFTNLSLLGSDGLPYSSPVRIARATIYWDTQSMIGAVLGILVKEVIGLEVEYVNCPDETKCHQAMLYCGGWSDGDCIPYRTATDAIALASKSKKTYPDPLPDVFVSLETWPSALSQSGPGVDDAMWQSRESTVLGPLGFTVDYGLYVFEEVLDKAWNATRVSLDNYEAYSTMKPLKYLVTPRHFMDRNVWPVPEYQGCPADNVTFPKAIQARMSLFLSWGYVCNRSWWLTPACAALGNGWENGCIAAVDDDWTAFKYDVYHAVSKGSLRIAQLILGYDAFQPLMLSDILNTSYFSWNLADAGFWRKHPVRVSMRNNEDSNDLIIVKLVLKQMQTANTKLAALLKNVFISQVDVLSMLEAVASAQDYGYGPTEDASAGFLQKVACDWIHNNPEVWQKWIPSPSTCLSGQFFAQDRLECIPCPEGTKAVHRGLNVAQCEKCAPGRFASDVGSTSCSNCQVGFFASAEGSTSCNPCPAGWYQDLQGQSQCKQCPDTFITSLQGSSGFLDCQCPKNSFLRQLSPGNATCVPCLEGLLCPGKASMPLQVAGYWAEVIDFPSRVFSVYTCRNAQECPAGNPGTCPAGRIGRACSQCQDYYFKRSDGTCAPCSSADKLPVIIVTLFSALIALFSNFIIVMDRSKQKLSHVTIVIMLGQSIAALQALQVVSKLSISWTEPVKSLMGIISVLDLDFNLIRSSCVTGTTSPLINMIILLFVLPLLLVSVFLGYLLSKLTSRPMKWESFCNRSGTIFEVIFITLTLALLMPLQCVINPNGKATITSNPGILCWDNDEPQQLVMTALSILGVLIYPVSFLAMVVWCTLKYPSRLLTAQGLKEIQKLNFIFGRFRSDTYYFSLLYISRNIGLSLIPVIFANYPALQIVAFAVSLLCASTLQIAFWPWRTSLCNIADWLSSFFIVLLLQTLGPLQDQKDSRLPAIIIFIVFVFLITAVVGLILYILYRKFRPVEPFGIFLCHYKADAGALCRFIKLESLNHSSTKMFLDSDEFVDLDHSLDTIRCGTKNLVVILSADMLTRFWSAAEIVTGFRNKLQILPVMCDNYVQPIDQQIDEITMSWPAEQVNLLMRYGITIDMVKDAYRELLDLDALLIQRIDDIDAHKRLVVQILIKSGLPRITISEKQVRSKHARICVTGAMSEPEALSSMYVVQMLIQQASLEEVILLRNFDEAEAAADAPYEVFLVVLLSKAVLEIPAFAEVVLTMLEDRQFSTTIATLNAPSFQFPGSEFYDQLESTSLRCPSLGDVAGRRLAAVYRSLLGVIALPLSPLGSQRLLNQQIDEVCRRLQHHGLDVDKKLERSSVRF